MMAIAAEESTSLVAFTLPGTPYSVAMARFYVRAALGHHDLVDFTDDVETVTSELVSNAIAHASAQAVDLELLRLEDCGAVVVVVTDPCPLLPIKRHPAAEAEHGRGLLIVEALCPPAGDGHRTTPARPCSRSSPGRADPVEAIADLPMLNDIDADYFPQYVKLARILRAKIEAGQHSHGDTLPASDLAQKYGVSVRVVWHALAMLAANRYVHQSGRFAPYTVTWQAAL